MKKLSVLFAAVMMFVTVGVAHAQKTASIDYEAILAAMPETKKMTTDLDTFSKTKGDELNKQAEAFQKEVQQYQAEGAKMTEAQRQAKRLVFRSIVYKVNGLIGRILCKVHRIAIDCLVEIPSLITELSIPVILIPLIEQLVKTGIIDAELAEKPRVITTLLHFHRIGLVNKRILDGPLSECISMRPFIHARQNTGPARCTDRSGHKGIFKINSLPG